MNVRDIIEGVVAEVLAETVEWEGYEGEDLDAACNHCGQSVWLVREKSHPDKAWVECGGIGEGACDGRFGDGDGESESGPQTKRSLEDPDGVSSKLKRSV